MNKNRLDFLKSAVVHAVAVAIIPMIFTSQAFSIQPDDFFVPTFRMQVNGEELPSNVTSRVTRLSVMCETGKVDQFSIELANSPPELRLTNSTDADLFQQDNKIKIQMGYRDQLQPVFEGEVTRITAHFPEKGTPTVTVRGTSRLRRKDPDERGKSLTLEWGKTLMSFDSTRDVQRPVGSDEESISGGNDSHLQFVTGNGSAIGMPKMLTGEVIELKGMGIHVNGLYYVRQLTHTMDSNGYVTSFLVRRNATE